MNITSPMASRFEDSLGFKPRPKPSKKKSEKMTHLASFDARGAMWGMPL